MIAVGMQRYGKCMNGGERTPSVEEGLPAIRRVNLDVQGARDVTTEAPRPVVVLLGMHRSGTSLLSNVLHILGVDMADTTDHVSPKNAGGSGNGPSWSPSMTKSWRRSGGPLRSPVMSCRSLPLGGGARTSRP